MQIDLITVEKQNPSLIDNRNGIQYYSDGYVVVQDGISLELIDNEVLLYQEWELRLPLAMGFLFLALRDKFGLSAQEIAVRYGYASDQSVADRISVSNCIARENLGIRGVSFSHFKAVTFLKNKPNEQKQWLEMARDEKIGVGQFRSMLDSAYGKNEPLRFPEPKPKSNHGIEPLAALGSADGGSDYLVDRQDESVNSYGNEKANGNGRYHDNIDYALGPQAERLSHDSDLEEDIYQLRSERDNLREQLLESEERRKDTLEALEDNQRLVTRLRSEKEQSEGIVKRLVATLTDNHLAYDWFLLKQLFQNDVITHKHYDSLMALRNEESFDDKDEMIDTVTYEPFQD